MDKRTCDDCGNEFIPTHPLNRYCASHRGRRAAKQREYHDVECVECGKAFRSARSTGKLCSDACRSQWYKQVGYGARQTVCHLPADHPVRHQIRELGKASQMRSALRVAVESGDRDAIVAEVRRACTEDGECWIWGRRLNDGYPVVRMGKRTHLVHRLVLEAKMGAALGKQAAHHTCARPACVNPSHLQPVTARDNTAEMLARTYMLARIADLEAALAHLDPTHPLLAEIGVSAA